MMVETKVTKHALICEEINDLYARKNQDYGDSFHQTFTEEGMAMARIRLGDKLARQKLKEIGCDIIGCDIEEWYKEEGGKTDA